MPAARADVALRLGDTGAAVDLYRRALSLTSTDPERAFLERRIADLEAGTMP